MRSLITLTALLFPAAALAQAPALLPVQGLLTNGDGAPIDGPTDLTFAIYDVETGGTALFSETQNIDVDAGLFTAYVGGANPLDLALFAGDRWLGVTVASDAEMPRFRLATTPYAAFAQTCGDAATLTGAAATDFAPAVHTHDFGELASIPPDLADGDDDTTYTAGTGITINGSNQIAANTAYFNSNYAATNHTHAAPALDCVTQIATLNVGAAAVSTGFAQCPAGYTITGGGYNLGAGVNQAEITIFDAYPDRATNRFNCGAHNAHNTASTTLECRVACCRIQ